MSYQQTLQKLMAQGWKPGDAVPTELIEASNDVSVAPDAAQLGKVGSPSNPLELSTMTVIGSPPSAPQAGAAPQAGSGSIYDGMTDEQVGEFGAMGDLRRQQAQAQEMRGTKDAKGKYLNQGRTYVAASPLEHLVVGAKRFKGQRDAKKIGAKQTKGRTSMIDLLRDKKKGPGVNKDTIVDGEIGNGSTGFFDLEEDTTRYS